MIDECEPFDNAEQVWFWFCGCLLARGDGLRSSKDYVNKIRNCEICDIYRIVKRMKFLHQISNRHLRVMTKWGCLNFPPYYDSRAKRSEIRLWDDGIRCFEKHLKEKGII